VPATFDLPAQSGTARDQAILTHATSGDLEIAWVPLVVMASGHTVEILVTPDAVKLASVRINVSATVQQQLADYFGALLFTPKVADLHYLARAATIPPQPMPITSSTAAMQQESQKMDSALAAAGGIESGGILGTVGKHWVIDSALTQHSDKAENYGWYMPAGTKSPWNGVAIYPSVTTKALVIQQPSWAHDPSHVDYSQQACFMHRSCKADGQPADLANVLQDPTLSALLSHNGPLTVLRQPGVALFSCPSPTLSQSSLVETRTSNSGLCPMPPAPAIATTSSGVGLGAAVAAGAAIVGAGATVAWLLTR